MAAPDGIFFNLPPPQDYVDDTMDDFENMPDALLDELWYCSDEEVDIPHKSGSEAPSHVDIVQNLVSGPTMLKDLVPVVMKIQGRRCAFSALFQLFHQSRVVS